MTVLYPLQVSAILRVIPAWLPPVVISVGFVCVSIGMLRQYFEGTFAHRPAYSPAVGVLGAICWTGCIAGVTYITIQQRELRLLFVFFVFMSGRVIQGGITARFLQKILDFVLSSGESATERVQGGSSDLVDSIKDRIVLFAATGIITTHTALSVIAVFVIGTGDPIEAIERFWVGFFFLTLIGLIFDFRHFAHRISWTAAIGLVIATAGAFLFNPVGFSSYTVALSPYLTNPIPNWMRRPLGVVGFLFGVLLWAVFYLKES